MRVTLERADLLKSLTHVHRVVERRNTIPILSNVLLRAADGVLSLKATDLDLEIIDSCPAMVERPGATTVPAHLFYEIVRKLRDGAQIILDLHTDGSSVTLRSGRSDFNMQVLPDSDFPDLTAGEFTHRFSMKGGELKHLIDRTQFAISTEETRYYLNGIYFHCADEGSEQLFRAVATDGHRLARAQIEAPIGAQGMPGTIVSRKTVGEIHRLLDDPDAEVTLELSENKVRFTMGETVLTAKLIEGTFPDYQRVIPQGNDKEMIVDCDEFRAAVDRVSTISTERGRAVKLAMSESRLILTVNNPESGMATEEVTVEYDSDSLDIGFNSRYLLDIASQLETDTAVFLFADAGSPTLVRDAGDNSSLYVLMPMRV